MIFSTAIEIYVVFRAFFILIVGQLAIVGQLGEEIYL